MKILEIIDTQYGDKFLLESDYQEKDLIKSLDWNTSHRMWDQDRKAWTVDATYENMELLKEMDCEVPEHISNVFEKKKEERKEIFELSKAAEADVDIPGHNKFDYYPFQKAGVLYAVRSLKRNGGVMICDEMGLGKTIQAIGAVNMMDDINKVLVVCPASVKLNWKGELQDWLTKDLSIEVVQSPSSYNPSYKDEDINPFDDIIDSDILIINYDNIEKYSKELKEYGFDAIILDESHYIKNYKAQRTKAAKEVAESLKYVINLTGTPIKNRPIELFTQISLVTDEFGFWEYVKKYCDAKQTRWGWDMTGSSNLDELYERLRSTCMVRRLKSDVLTELPPKTRQVIELPNDGVKEMLEDQNRVLSERDKKLDELRKQVELAKAAESDEEYYDAVERLKEGITAGFEELAAMRKETAIKKVPYIVEHVENVLESKNKVVVFVHHQVAVKALKDKFGDTAVVIDGNCSDEERQDAVDQFQNNDDINVFIGSMHAAGEGITLTASDHMVFGEVDWTPATMSQCEDRIHRIGQESDNVMYQYLVLEDSIDSEMIKQVVNKLQVIEKALDKAGVTGDERLKLKKEKINETVTDYKKQYNESSTKSASKRKIEKKAEEITDEQVYDVHTKLKALAEMCDGAASEDQKGFNKFDTDIGKELAKQDSLTKKQAALGMMIVKKYRGQVGSVVGT